VRLLLFILVAICGFGCEDLSPIPVPVKDAGDGSSNPDTSENDPGAEFEGRWGGLLAWATRTHNLFFLGNAWAITWAWGIFDIVSDGDGQLTVTMKGCHEAYRTPIPNASVQATSIDDKERKSELTLNVRVVSDESETRFISERIYIQYGVNLCDVAETQLTGSFRKTENSDCDGPCTNAYCDQDGDGKTGKTYILSAKQAGVESFRCEVSVSGIDEFQFSGTLINEDTIEGAFINPRFEMVIHEADHPFCDVDSVTAESDGCDKHQYFRFVRIADDASCDVVRNMTDCTEQNLPNCDTDDPKPLDPNPTREDDNDCETE
jgi:hypothetical protein